MPEWKVSGYTEMKTLGSGGFGDVMLARHDASGTLVTIKYLRHELLADAEFTGMFRGEATVLASLDDPNVVRLYEYVESPAGAAIVMELISGISLREILRVPGQDDGGGCPGGPGRFAAGPGGGAPARRDPPGLQARERARQGDGISKLTDFGIAARAGGRPLPAGTLLYAAPEQMAGAPATPTGDVYAATATFHECLTGRPPFNEDDADLIRQHRFEPVPLEPVPEPLRPLVAAGMAKDPARRPVDATTLVGQLKTAAPGAYGRDWQERGRSHLGEAALQLAILWPAGPPPAIHGSAVDRLRLSRGSQASRESRHWWHLRHLRHEEHEQHLRHEEHEQRLGRRRRLRTTRTAVMAGAALAVVAAATALAATIGSRAAASDHPAAVVQPISLQSSSARPSPNAGPRTSTSLTQTSQSGSLPSPTQTSQSGPSPSPTQTSQSVPPENPAPAAPSDLTAAAVDPNDIELSWQANSTDQTGFEISNGVTSTDVGAGSTSYTWGDLSPGTYMCFKVLAYNSAGDSAWDPDVSPYYVCTTTPSSGSAG